MKPLKPILLVEDDYVDAATITQALNDVKVKNPVVHRTDGELGLEYLRDHKCPKPGIIFLDLNMPKVNGIEMLKAIKADQTLKDIPVVVMTVSKYEQDKVETFDLGVAGYIIKPVDYEVFLRSIDTVIKYWAYNDCVVQERETQNANL